MMTLQEAQHIRNQLMYSFLNSMLSNESITNKVITTQVGRFNILNDVKQLADDCVTSQLENPYHHDSFNPINPIAKIGVDQENNND